MLIALLQLACQNENPSDSWAIALKTDKDGNVLNGSKSKLINAIRGGADLKIGWGWKNGDKSLEHVAIPNWIGILNEQEVYVYLDHQVLSGIDWENLRPSYQDSSLVNQEWRVAISTDGSFDAIWIDRKQDTLRRRVPQNHIMTWWVKAGHSKTPLFSH